MGALATRLWGRRRRQRGRISVPRARGGAPPSWRYPGQSRARHRNRALAGSTRSGLPDRVSLVDRAVAGARAAGASGHFVQPPLEWRLEPSQPGSGDPDARVPVRAFSLTLFGRAAQFVPATGEEAALGRG